MKALIVMIVLMLALAGAAHADEMGGGIIDQLVTRALALELLLPDESAETRAKVSLLVACLEADTDKTFEDNCWLNPLHMSRADLLRNTAQSHENLVRQEWVEQVRRTIHNIFPHDHSKAAE